MRAPASGQTTVTGATDVPVSYDCPVVEFAEDAEMSRRQASADEFQRVIGCFEGESWSYFVSDEATIYDVWFDDDSDDVVRRVRSLYGIR
jgi:hypothetical protein